MLCPSRAASQQDQSHGDSQNTFQPSLMPTERRLDEVEDYEEEQFDEVVDDEAKQLKQEKEDDEPEEEDEVDVDDFLNDTLDIALVMRQKSEPDVVKPVGSREDKKSVTRDLSKLEEESKEENTGEKRACKTWITSTVLSPLLFMSMGHHGFTSAYPFAL